jgi:hypothetical protein
MVDRTVRDAAVLQRTELVRFEAQNQSIVSIPIEPHVNSAPIGGGLGSHWVERGHCSVQRMGRNPHNLYA